MADTDIPAIPSTTGNAQAFYFKDHNPELPTRASTPATEPMTQTYGSNGDGYLHVPDKSMEVCLEATPGVLPEDVYDSVLSWWRAGIRRQLVRNLKTESPWLAAMQASFDIHQHPKHMHVDRRRNIGTCEDGLARCLLRVHFVFRNAHIFHDTYPCRLLLWTRQDSSRVRGFN